MAFDPTDYEIQHKQLVGTDEHNVVLFCRRCPAPHQAVAMVNELTLDEITGLAEQHHARTLVHRRPT